MFLECSGNYCWLTFVLWGGFCLVLFQSFVICHLLIASVCNYRQSFALEANPFERLAGRSTSTLEANAKIWHKTQQESLLAGPTDFSHLIHYFFLDLITDIGCIKVPERSCAWSLFHVKLSNWNPFSG